MITQMNEAVLLIYLLNFIFIGLLPKLFFKKDGRFNLMWWVTASPFFLCTVFLLLSYAGYLPRLSGYGTSAVRVLESLSVLLTVTSIALIFFTLGTHRIPIALWHQDNDAPKHIVTYGAYRWIRHPFYASFLLALFGALVFCPQWGTFVTFIQGLVILNLTAAKEERRLCASQFGAEYAEYMRRTGRFWPRFGESGHSTGVREPG
jgi:protein-S-isoprenylcysteine O-methyltransferase Ste14